LFVELLLLLELELELVALLLLVALPLLKGVHGILFEFVSVK
jgi:hypothetical protein